MTTERLPIWRDANRLLLGVEQAVRGFGRYHKYSLGSDLRRQALRVCQYLARALSTQGPERPPQVRRFLQAVDDLKILIQLAKELRAFRSFSEFQQIAELAVATGKQGGAWMRRLSRPGVRPEPGSLA